MTARTAHFQSRIPAPRAYVWAHYTRPGMFERLAPPWQHIRVIRNEGDVRPGDRLILSPRVGPLRITWEAVHGEYVEGRLFSDRQERGPFASWQHRHHFLDAGEGGCIVRDELTIALPLAPLAHPLALPFVARELRRMFYYRHFTAYHDLLEHYALREDPRQSVVVRGGPREIRSQIAAYLSVGGHELAQETGDAQAGAVEIELSGDAATGLTVVLRGVERGPSTRRMTTAMLLDHSAATRLRIARLLLADPDRALRWTTLDDVTGAVHRLLLGVEAGDRHHVAHPTTATPLDLARCIGPAIRLLARMVPDAASDRAEPPDQRGSIIVSRYRSAAHALQVMDGRSWRLSRCPWMVADALVTGCTSARLKHT